MQGRTLVDSSCRATILAPIESIDLTSWLFALTDSEYQNCSDAHLGAGSCVSGDGKRVSLNIERIGGNLYVQHYHEVISERTHCQVKSLSNVLNKDGTVKTEIAWSLSVHPIDSASCEFVNRFFSATTPDMEEAFIRTGAVFEQLKDAAQLAADAHNAEETPNFARDIERKAKAGRFLASGLTNMTGADYNSCAVRALKKELFKAQASSSVGNIEESRRGAYELAAANPPAADVHSTNESFGGLPAVRVWANGASRDRAIYYLHGGGFILGAPSTQLGMLGELFPRSERARHSARLHESAGK